MSASSGPPAAAAASMAAAMAASNDERRLETLYRYGVLDTPAEAAFDDLTRLATAVCDAPIAAISFVDRGREWFKAEVGMNLREVPLDASACVHVLAGGDLLVVPDAAADRRFADNPLVTGGPRLRFYAGAVLRTADGQALGTLCVLDYRPRDLTATQRDGLRRLAGQVMAQLELRRTIADLRRAEASGRHARADADAEHARLDELFRRSPAFMAVLRGPQHVFERVNDRCAELIGRRDVVGKPVREALPEVADQGFFELLDRVYATGEPYVGRDVRLAVRRAPGQPPEERFLDFVYQPTRDPDGAVTGVLVHGVDLTDRRRAEASLAESRRRLQALFDNAQDAILLADDEARYVDANPAAVALTGYTREELLARRVWDITPPPDHANTDELWRGFLAAGRQAGEYALARKDGTAAVVEYRAVAHILPGLHLSVLRDVSERKRAEQAFQMRDQQFRALLDGVRDYAIFIVGVDGRIASWHEGAAVMKGYTHDEAIGMPFANLFTPEDRAKGQPQREMDVAARRGEYKGQGVRLRKDGTLFEAFVVLTATRGPDGELLGYLKLTQDISRRRRFDRDRDELLGRERAARTEAERAGRMKDEFLATLSHELRTPLNAILGWSQVLRRGGGSDPADLARGLDVIERNARGQTQIIEDLLDMSRIVSGKIRLDVQRLDLATVVGAAIDTARPAAAGRGVDLRNQLEPGSWFASGDPNRLQQVFWNLLSNAVKFTPRGGRVEVRVARTDSAIEVTVADTGEGIDPEFLPHVFDRFTQADPTITRRHGGLGIGLAIVKQLVELHGGTIRAASPGLGHGTTFTVALPPAPAPAGPGAQAGTEADCRRHAARSGLANLPEACDQLAGVRVLAVDDEPDARDLLKRLLEDCGAVVTTAGSADEALALLQADPPGVLVCDVGMPREDGYALVRRVRALGRDRGGDVPAVAVTAYAAVADRVQAILAGFQMHVAKPVEPAELIAVVASLARRT